ncbi:hypothetical protein [Fusobacterium pseudoperiodonticum]|uniref:Uncharacterized protein n=1 Tax=Fusobacterium pseudoperiodonticum TaxID=2663009 RepID=A0A2G9EE92_9FUSO|nr:hypothetical protein [Fusobacterium pseudoperiodonticum]PIM79185.1 hypothetical protein CTM71_01340 [Fusobacterium pseudoperiodonticum]
MNLNKKYRNKVLKIMELAIKKTVSGKRDIFVGFSGHVGNLSVIIYKSGWGIEKEADFRKDFINLDDKTIVDEEHKKMLEKELDNIIKIIEEL